MCDDNMRAVFGTEKVDMFRMNKVLGRYVYFDYFKIHVPYMVLHLGIYMPSDNAGERYTKPTCP
jgi:hypothetical protein